MSKHHRIDTGPALGQVFVFPFVEKIEDILANPQLLVGLMTWLIIKPLYAQPLFKIIGGMLKEPDDPWADSDEATDDAAFEAAAAEELCEETGIVANPDPRQRLLVYTGRKKQGYPNEGDFEVRIYFFFGCDITKIFDPESDGFDGFGDEGEVVKAITFGDIKPRRTWSIPRNLRRRTIFHPGHFELVSEAMQNLPATIQKRIEIVG